MLVNVPFALGLTSTVTDSATLGGKGASLVAMANLGLPVPPGIIMSTGYSVEYNKAKLTEKTVIANGMIDYAWGQIGWIKEQLGLDVLPMVSVRSGAPVSMPGMMNTILNVGLTEKTLPYWSNQLGERAALDCYRRLIQMLGETAYDVPMEQFEAALTEARFRAKVTSDSALTAEHLKAVVAKYLNIFKAAKGHAFPNTYQAQLGASIRAVLKSWNNKRAVEYREMNKISHDMGTAIVVQAMVFGNFNDQSGSGVLFTRSPSTGVDEIFGEYLANAQGEDVVAGIRTPITVAEATKSWPDGGKKLADSCAVLEAHYKDMVDIEFTIQDNKLYILQSRVGKRSALAAVKIAYDLMVEGRVSQGEALAKLSKSIIRTAIQPTIRPDFKVQPNFTGLGSNIGVVSGIAVGTSDAAKASKVPCILVREETDPDDIGGMNAAIGILTATGGATSHAAVVARAMQKPCVVGCTGLPISTLLGKKITIDGNTGRVWVDVDVPLLGGTMPAEIIEFAKRLNPKARFIIRNGDARVGAQNVIVDVNGPIQTEGYDPDADTVFTGVALNSEDADLNALFAPAHDTDVEHNQWFSSLPSKARISGFPTFSGKNHVSLSDTAESLEEVLDTKNLSLSPAAIKAVGQSVWDKLSAVLAGAGFEKMQAGVYPPVYVVMSAVSGE